MSQPNRACVVFCALFTAVVLIRLGLAPYLDEVCATWRVAVLLFGGAAAVFFLNYNSGTKQAFGFAEAGVPLLVVAAILVASGGVWWSAHADQITVFIERAL